MKDSTYMKHKEKMVEYGRRIAQGEAEVKLKEQLRRGVSEDDDDGLGRQPLEKILDWDAGQDKNPRYWGVVVPH